MRRSPIQPLFLLLSAAMVFSGASLGQDLSSPPQRFEGGGPVDVPSLTSKANVIVRGIVSGSETKWVGRTIYTEYTLQVQETLKGGARNTLTVAVLGGSMGGVELVIPGAPKLETGNEVVFFGERFDAQESFKPVGIFDGIVPVAPAAGIGASVAPRGRPESLADFLEEVRGLGRNR
jgi:hypothetical protein